MDQSQVQAAQQSADLCDQLIEQTETSNEIIADIIGAIKEYTANTQEFINSLGVENV